MLYLVFFKKMIFSPISMTEFMSWVLITVVMLSASVISYKGLMMPVDLPAFFPDLGDSAMETAIVVFHQRSRSQQWNNATTGAWLGSDLPLDQRIS